jgi:hypothetical protein
MFKPKTTISGRLDNSSGEWIRTTDLRVMRYKHKFLIAYSGACRPVNPEDVVHRFRSMPSTQSGGCRPLFRKDRNRYGVK